MGQVLDFKKALAKKNYEQHGLRQVIPNDFVKRALAAGRQVETKIEFRNKEENV